MVKSKVIWKKKTPLGLVEVRDGGDVFFYNFYSEDGDWFIGTTMDSFGEEEILEFWDAVLAEKIRHIREDKLFEAHEEYLAKAH